MTREEFFDKLNNGAKWDVGVAINRTNPLPQWRAISRAMLWLILAK